MVNCGFIFDIIIVRIDTPNQAFDDPNLLTVDVNFNNVSLNITPSRINVVEFRSGRSYEFESDPDELRNELESCSLKLRVKYNEEVIGAGEMNWPDSVLGKISDQLGELTHVDELELLQDENKIGCVEIIVRLQCKCQEMGFDSNLRNCDDIRRHLDRVINPHDILFVVGEPQKEEDECTGLLPTGSQLAPGEQHATALDLSRYRSMNGQMVQTPDVLNTCVNPDCCELKKISNQYQQLLDNIMACPGSGGGKREGRNSCNASSRCRDGSRDNKHSATSSSRDQSSDGKFPCSCFAAQHDDGGYSGEKLLNICPKVSSPNLEQTVHQKPRRCPVCQENINWLPKLAACPKCGYKPTPFTQEKTYNEKLTADQILHEFLDNRSSATEQNQSGTDIKDKQAQCEQKKECRCTCKNGKICAHCRIRKLCADMFQSNSKTNVEANDDCGKCEANSSDMYNICKSSSKDCRPYLARVFSELRDLYDIKKPKPKGFDLNQRCERNLQGEDEPKKRKQNVPSAIKKNQQQQQQQQQQRQQVKQYQQQQQQIKEQQQQQQQEQSAKRKRRKRRRAEQQDYDENDLTDGCLSKREKADGCMENKFQNAEKACKNIVKYKNTNRPERVTHHRKIAHKTCVNGQAGHKNVPGNMGWLWNADSRVIKRGWKPGAIRKPIKEMMRYFLRDFPADTIRVSQYSYRNQGKTEAKDGEDEVTQKPTLHICKKNDEYFITLRPLKDAEALKQCADPYLKMKPIQFKIVKNPLLTEMRNLKRCLKDMGFSKCTCHKPVIECFCRGFLDRKRLEYQVNKECRKRNIPCCNDSLVLSDTTDSDVEFDFGVTPPAGVVKPERLKKPDMVNHGTQYVMDDWNVAPVFPKPQNKYMKGYNCVTGARYVGGAVGGVIGGGGGGDGKSKGKGEAAAAGKANGKAGGDAGKKGGKAEKPPAKAAKKK